MRSQVAALYRGAIEGCAWITPQHVPEGCEHSWWTYAVACDTPQRALLLADAIVKHGGERPYPAWRLTYDEPAFLHLPYLAKGGPAAVYRKERSVSFCPVAESLQPRLLQFQTNDLASAERNATALRAAIQEIGA